MFKIKYVIPIALMMIISACDTRSDAEKRYDEASERLSGEIDRISDKANRDWAKSQRGEKMEYYRKCKENAYGETICTTEYGYPD
tara:strand:+ start:137 stop:391 length:255 start_codon:yes stop_codon:yes gene_type:complete